MHGSKLAFAFGCFGVAAGTACGESSDGGGGVTKWLGPTAHLAVVGRLEGEDLDFRLEGAEAADVLRLWCKREYKAPPDAQGKADLAQAVYAETEVQALVAIGTRMQRLEFEIGHDIAARSPGDRVPIQEEIKSVPFDPSAAKFEWEWLDEAGDEYLEVAALSGYIVLGEASGMPMAGTVVKVEGSGAIGGFIRADWSASDSLSISFHAPCTENDVKVSTPK